MWVCVCACVRYSIFVTISITLAAQKINKQCNF